MDASLSGKRFVKYGPAPIILFRDALYIQQSIALVIAIESGLRRVCANESHPTAAFY